MKRVLTSLVLILLFAAPSFAFNMSDCGIKDIPMTYKGEPVHLLVCSDSSQICNQAFIFGKKGLEYLPGLDCDPICQKVTPPSSHHDYYPCSSHGVCKW